MEPQYDHQNEGNFARPDFADGKPFQARNSQDFQDVRFDSFLQTEFSDLGFDLQSMRLTHDCSAGDFIMLTHRDPFGEPGQPLSLIEYRILVGPLDRDGEIINFGEENSTDRRIIAIQAACINALDISDVSPRCVFEKTYTIGQGSLPDKTCIMADIIRAQRSYLQQLRNVFKFFQASKTTLS